jgi:putative drug exporter of the RND superfamily
VLLPSVMALLGERNWYLPGWLAWLPRISHAPRDLPVPAGLSSPAAVPEHSRPSHAGVRG